MALSKQITTVYNGNVFATYWKIANIDIDWIESVAKVKLIGFVSQDARTANKGPIDTKTFNWSGSNFPFIEAGYDVTDEETQEVTHVDGLDDKTPRQLAYTCIKTKKTTEIQDGREVEIDSIFSDAEDV